MVENNTTENKIDRKKSSWEYSLVTHRATVNFPDGSSKMFNLTERVKDLPATLELMIYYGFKQWLASNTADPKVYTSSEEKITAMTEDYEGFMSQGLELIGEGKIGVLGRAKPKSEDKAAFQNAKAAAKVVSLEGLIMKKMLYPKTFTEEDQSKLDEFLARVSA